MTWNEMYPVVTEQAKYAVLRYDERRQDKVQELVCQAFEKYQIDIAAGKEIKKQPYKCFVTQRAKEVDVRSVCKDGFGGTSQLDVLGYYLRREDSPIEVGCFDEWMPTNAKSREAADSALTFNVDYSIWMSKLNDSQKRIVDYLVQGFSFKEISAITRMTRSTIKKIVQEIQQACTNYFGMEVCS